MNSKTLRRDICVKVCGREAMMQEKSKEQGNGHGGSDDQAGLEIAKE
jgi:hypothetical protein